ncbi:MAG: cyclic beta 1-2 glucan synthetase [Candidatus Riflebacteria bacterium]|nr:cyclic beta 1-2 glucan synthetase [Candidatus Riflebacteria bacterium]
MRLLSRFLTLGLFSRHVEPGTDREGPSGAVEESPLRSELFSVDQLQVHAKAIAGWHKLAPKPGPDLLLSRLDENQEALQAANEQLTAVARHGRRLSPAAEWLIDSFYLIEEQIRIARSHLPRTYSRQLPRLANGPSAGQPRVYHIALELIAHLDGRIDAESVTSFVASYQVTTPLRLGELWAVPIMLRLGLIENLRRVATRIATGHRDRNLAVAWANHLIGVADKEPANLILVLADMARSRPVLSTAFVAGFSGQLRGKNPTLVLPLSWLAQRLSETAQSIEECVHQETQKQSADQVSMSNSIASLRLLSAIDWRDFVEALSVVEQTLRGDPSGVYGAMDFATRDRYRHVVEDVARRGGRPEDDVARQAIALAARSLLSDGAGRRTAHVGYYLVDRGLDELEAGAGARVPLRRRLVDRITRAPLLYYLGLILATTAALTAGLARHAAASGAGPLGLALLFLVAGFSAMQLSIALVDWLTMLLVLPRMLPRMDYSKGVPAGCRTIVVVPTMLTGTESLARLLEGLEVRYLANRDPSIHFALLTDLADASQETLPPDSGLVEAARQGIMTLNARYGHERSDAFFLFHRPRRFNPSEGLWMGHERKRGKLADLTGALRGSPDDRCALVVGETGILTSVRYVITLDTDTELPRDAGRRLVATLSHPLVGPEFDPVTGQVTAGYSILQPRLGIRLPSASRSWFVRLFAGETGIDPYTQLVSDVYQDLFGEGSFIGKGIFHVDAFERTLAHRFPENRILSHDLLEGCHARAGLVSDVQLYEDHPWHYGAEMRRRHRWVRGDWQIAPWLWPWVPGPDSCRVANPLTVLSRWKILDNLRRSLVPAALVGLLFLGWTSPGPPAFWTLAVTGLILAPPLLATLVNLCRKPRELSLLSHFRELRRHLVRHLARVFLALVFLPYEACVNLDAVGRTLFRMIVTRRHFLEWETASDAEQRAGTDLASFIAVMGPAALLAALAGVLVVMGRPECAPAAGPAILLWLASPVFAWVVSRPIASKEPRLNRAQQELLRRTARRTWGYFETMAGPEDHFLPPDNVQEHPAPATAHRTSPTNIGMGLLASLAAHDFGYVSTGRLIERTAGTLSTMDRLERHRGHFLNWYDTRTLAPLVPQYVSTVDSGNLSGHLLTLRQGLLEIAGRPIVSPRTFDGVSDMILVLADQIHRSATRRDVSVILSVAVRLQRMLEELGHPPRTLSASLLLMQKLAAASTELARMLEADLDPEVRWAAGALAGQCQDLHADLAAQVPWIDLPRPVEPVHGGARPGEAPRPTALREALRGLDEIPTLDQIATLEARFSGALGPVPEEHVVRVAGLRDSLLAAADRASRRRTELASLASRCHDLAWADFRFLFDPAREQLSIGFNVSERRRDPSFYDLLASEARLASFVAIAQGQLPQESWFALGRLLTRAGGHSVLVSWSGSMFEYLMPLLVMPTYEGTLLDRTYHAAVARQIQYGRERGIPWGMSESAYNSTDAHLIYQYRAFGVPGLGFKRGLAEDLTIAPYATVMALMVSPEEAAENLERLAEQGLVGRYGYYEAADHTPSRVPRGETRSIVRSFMAHHQGMSLLSLAYLLLGRPMQRRFLADPLLKATELLLHERVPRVAPANPHAAQVEEAPGDDRPGATSWSVDTAHTPTPDVGLLSNGRYHVMVSNSGSGYSRWRDLAVTRWREDPTRDCWGSYCYLRDLDSRALWSTAYHPTLVSGTDYEAHFHQALVEIRRVDHEIHTSTGISVSPEDDVELRRVTLTNRSQVRRTIELTSYAEVVLTTPAADEAHPAFSNLFVQTEILPGRQAVLCTRRPRSAPERPPWMLHQMAVLGSLVGEPSYETDRGRFIGRGRSLEAPACMSVGSLSNTQGAVLDPVVAIRLAVVLGPDESASVSFVTGVAETREGATALIEKYQDPRLAERVFSMAWTQSQVVLRQINATDTDAQLFERMVSSLVHPHRQRRADPAILARNRRAQSALWSYSISGDLPIVLLRIGDLAKVELVRQMAQAHAYWRVKGLAVDLIIWNEDPSGYRQVLHDQITSLISGGTGAGTLDRPGGIFVRRPDQMTEEDRILVQTVARVVVTDSAGSLAEQMDRRGWAGPNLARLVPTRRRQAETPPPPLARRDLVFSNGLGGFTADGKEYVITTGPGRVTPAPWVNVLANNQLGTVVSESGSAFTWVDNAHEYRLTPWSNDPVSDGTGEALYIRDEEEGEFWSPTPLPARGKTPYVSRHGLGYSVFEHSEHGVSSELKVFVAVEAPVKLAVLRIKNHSERARRLSVTGYWEWVLADLRCKSLMHVVTELDPRTGALLARNSYSSDFGGKVAFVAVNDPARSVTGDRAEFLGRNGSLASPAALGRVQLSGRTGVGLDACAAIQVPFDLVDGQEHELVFVLGAGPGLEETRALIQHFCSAQGARQSLEEVWRYWTHVLGAVHVETPDPAVNMLANGWLLYQTLACRVRARSGFYQSGGAYGFRDQLQDTMALIHSEPWVLREQLLRSAAHQFPEGDVQHWWHPPSGRGVRTHSSDDYLWLPLATCRYVEATGDTGVLDEPVRFIEGRQVKPEEEAYYDQPARSQLSATLYEHCVKAVENGLRFGAHGLPLIGCGDWNDGMNRVGERGLGESVWLAFFLYDVLRRFGEIAGSRGDAAFGQRCADQAELLRQNIASGAWDGEWYRRAYFDDGRPMGSAASAECQIDSLPQSWSVLSGAGDPDRSGQAMAAADRRLIRRDAGLVLLFDPPFDASDLDPGYIKGYVPGVRENGGQYTHAAVWMAMAFALRGEHERAWELFSMINPINHGRTEAQVATYKVEPYVVAADVYARPPHTGRGGWTWYTGSAGWMYRLVVETLLGVTREPELLRLTPRLPSAWEGFKLHYRYRDTYYHVTVKRTDGSNAGLTVDGVPQPELAIRLVDDRVEHHAQLNLQPW